MNILREFFLGFVKIHILYHAGKEDFCGVDMMRELDRHGYTIGAGTLYPLLHTMLKGGYLRREKKVEKGRTRIYYKATPKAKLTLKEIRPKISELVSEVLE